MIERKRILATLDSVCIVCGQQYEAGHGRVLTCSEPCHEKLVQVLIKKYGEYKKVCSRVTGKYYRIPTRIIIEEGLTHHDLTKFPEWG